MASVTRRTNETDIHITLNFDGQGNYEIDTGIGFLDHMLQQLSRHSLIDLHVKAEGDLHIDFHHTTEDSGYAIGEAFSKALGDRKGIQRYGHVYIPMDETSRALPLICPIARIWYGILRLLARALAILIQNCFVNGFRPLHNLQV